MTFISQNTLLPSPSSSSSPLMDWLTFSLSNPHYQHFDDLHQKTHDQENGNNYIGGDGGGSGSGCGGPCNSSDLSMLSFGSGGGGGGPKLEDFLGMCGTTTTTTTSTTTTTTPPPPIAVCQFSGETQSNINGGNINNHFYESDQLKISTISASSFLNGGSYSMITTDEYLNPLTAVVNPVVVSSPVSKKTVDTFGQRTSIYRGVTRHRWTGRYEAHLWDNSCRREGQSRKGRQVYLGGYDKEDKAARAYDLAALKYWGPTTTTNFPVSNYEKEIEEMTNMNRQEFVASLRRKSSGFSRGASMYRGVTRHHQHGRWQARIGRVAGNKDLYLGTFSTQEEAAEAYDIAAIKFRGLNAVTNFDMSRYDVKSIANSNLPIGGITGKSSKPTSSETNTISDHNKSSTTTTTTLSDDVHRDFSSNSSIVLPFALQPDNNPSFALPANIIKPNPSSDHYWSLLGLSSSKNKNPPSGFLGGSSHDHHHNSSNLEMDLSSSSHSNDFDQTNNNGSFFNGGGGGGGGYVQQLQNYNTSSTSSSSSSMTSFATPSTNTYSASYGSSWVAPPLHGFQTVNPSLSVFQTPIFGME